MQTSSFMYFSKLPLAALVFGVSLTFGCQNKMFQPEPVAPPEMKTIPAVRLNYRYEADVPAPSIENNNLASEERNPEVLSDFDANRQFELLERSIASPDKKHILAVYRNIADTMAEYRLDIYSPDGKLQKKLTSDAMAVHFPDSIVWSPDSTTFAFVAMTRAAKTDSDISVPSPDPTYAPTVADSDSAPFEDEMESNKTTTASSPTPPTAPTGVLTFRTEQIYICGADGSGLKPLTENEGLIYFYYAWSPDSSMLAALATTAREWKYAEITAASKSEMMIPVGRLRTIEKNGRERRLDDNLTAVHPVWSPDSAKVAVAFETQIRIYDAGGANPTQAAIPLRNQLLISSQAYDRDQQRLAQSSNSDANVSTNTLQPDQPLSTLPDEKLLVSYNPIVELLWPEDTLLYLKTAYLRRPINDPVGVTSFARWHRLPLSIQTVTPAK
ncbi:MAG: hypothetical protein IPL32_07265 [Chloracidobacterium sp.]|nr:hypothetical protein [Chloracidobacterium sp.]